MSPHVSPHLPISPQAHELLGTAEREPSLWRQAEVEGARMLVAWAEHLEEYPNEPPPAKVRGRGRGRGRVRVRARARVRVPNSTREPAKGGVAGAHVGAELGAAASMLCEAAARLERSGRAAAAGDVHYRLAITLP